MHCESDCKLSGGEYDGLVDDEVKNRKYINGNLPNENTEYVLSRKTK